MNVAFVLLLYPFVVSRIGPRSTYVLFMALMIGVWPLYIVIRVLVRSSAGDVGRGSFALGTEMGGEEEGMISGWAWAAIVLQYVCNAAGLTCYGASVFPVHSSSGYRKLTISRFSTPYRRNATPPNDLFPTRTPRHDQRPRTNGAFHRARHRARHRHLALLVLTASGEEVHGA